MHIAVFYVAMNAGVRRIVLVGCMGGAADHQHPLNNLGGTNMMVTSVPFLTVWLCYFDIYSASLPSLHLA